MAHNPDVLTGTPELSQYNTYQVVCPIFDARSRKGNFAGANIPGSMRNPYSESGFVRVINMIQAQHYFIDRHYQYTDMAFQGVAEGEEIETFTTLDLLQARQDARRAGRPIPDNRQINWDRFRARVIPFMDRAEPIDEDVVAKFTAFVKLVLTPNGEAEPSAQKYLMAVTTTRNQLFTPECEGRPVPANPRTLKNFNLWRTNYQPNRTRASMSTRAPR